MFLLGLRLSPSVESTANTGDPVEICDTVTMCPIPDLQCGIEVARLVKSEGFSVGMRQCHSFPRKHRVLRAERKALRTEFSLKRLLRAVCLGTPIWNSTDACP